MLPNLFFYNDYAINVNDIVFIRGEANCVEISFRDGSSTTILLKEKQTMASFSSELRVFLRQCRSGCV